MGFLLRTGDFSCSWQTCSKRNTGGGLFFFFAKELTINFSGKIRLLYLELEVSTTRTIKKQLKKVVLMFEEHAHQAEVLILWGN